MKFSVIIPAYNAQSYLEACVRSVLHQSEPDWEIILVDDGSTDHTGEICACYAARYPQKITVLRQRNAGLSAARNAGIRAAKGEYLLLLDSDDILTGDALKRLKKACSGLGGAPDVVAFEYQCFSQEEELAEPKPYLQLPEEDVPFCGEKYLGRVLEQALERGVFFQWSAWAYAYRRAWFAEKGFAYPVGRNYEDLWLTWRVLLAADWVRPFPEVVYGYRVNVKNSITKTYSYKNINDRLCSAVQNMQALQADPALDPAVKSLLADLFSEHYFITLTVNDLPATRQQRKKLLQEQQKNIWVCRFSLRKSRQLLAQLIDSIGLPAVCFLLHLRRRLRYPGRFRRAAC